MRRNFVLKKLPDHHRRIDLKEDLESRQRDNLHHRAGREIGSQTPIRVLLMCDGNNVGGERRRITAARHRQSPGFIVAFGIAMSSFLARSK